MPKTSKNRVKLPDGWYPGEFDEHEYVIYQCGCSFHKVINFKKNESKKKWKLCKVHQKKMDEAQKIYDNTWNGIMEGKISKRTGRKKQVVESPVETPRLNSIKE